MSLLSLRGHGSTLIRISGNKLSPCTITFFHSVYVSFAHVNVFRSTRSLNYLFFCNFFVHSFELLNREFSNFFLTTLIFVGVILLRILVIMTMDCKLVYIYFLCFQFDMHNLIKCGVP